MTTLDTHIEIAASAARVWAILTDFAAYPQWNPFIVRIEGRLRAGAQLTLQLSLPGKPVMTVRPRLKVIAPPRELRWAGQVLAPGLLDGEHGFEIHPLDATHCRLRHVEDFSGVLVPLFSTALKDSTQAGFEALNQALKLQAERLG